VKIRLAVPAMKLPSAALISSNQLMRASMLRWLKSKADYEDLTGADEKIS
jgi:hypothetical protein